jgi:hypothetical protein
VDNWLDQRKPTDGDEVIIGNWPTETLQLPTDGPLVTLSSLIFSNGEGRELEIRGIGLNVEFLYQDSGEITWACRLIVQREYYIEDGIAEFAYNETNDAPTMKQVIVNGTGEIHVTESTLFDKVKLDGYSFLRAVDDIRIFTEFLLLNNASMEVHNVF